MGALDRGIELQFAFRDMAARTGIVVGLWSACVTLSGREIDIIVTRTTRGSSGLGQPIDALAGCAVVTRLTIIYLLWISRVRKIVHALVVPNNDVRGSGLNTREIGPRVNLVDHHLEVHGVACVGIRGLRRMA